MNKQGKQWGTYIHIKIDHCKKHQIIGYKKTYPASNEALRRVTVPPVGTGSNPHNMRVDCTRYTVLHLHVQLRQSVGYITLTNQSPNNKNPNICIE